MLPPEFSVTVGRCRDTMTLAVTGDLDLATAPRLAEHLAMAGGDDVRAVVLDLRGLTFLDSSGIALLLSATRRAEAEGWSLTIAGTPPQARYVIELCGLLDVLPLAA
jgi:anti-sigma B factor antagonist